MANDFEDRLDALFLNAFETNHPAMYDFALLKMELKELRQRPKVKYYFHGTEVDGQRDVKDITSVEMGGKFYHDGVPQKVDPGYDEIKAVLLGLPSTWYPALVKLIVEEAVKAKAFIPGNVHLFVKKIEAPNEC